MGGIATEAFFLPADPGYRFCLLNTPPPGGRIRGAVLHVHALAEEMNKARRQVAVTARALAADGWAVLQMDLLGCGDSSGAFGDASWAAWLDDLVTGSRWLTARFGAPLSLWGLRFGCLLAAQCITRLEAEPDLIFWQPVLSGRTHLMQFVRLKVAGDALGEASARTDTNVLLGQIARGETIEIAGYALAPALAVPMQGASLDLPQGYRGRVQWCEVSSGAEASLAPASQTLVEAWRARGIAVSALRVDGLPFWQTQEIAECTALIEATVRPHALASA